MLRTLHDSKGTVRTRIKFTSAAKVYIGLLWAKQLGLVPESGWDDFRTLITNVNASWHGFVRLCSLEQRSKDVVEVGRIRDKGLSVERMFYSIGSDFEILELFLRSQTEAADV